MNSLKEIRYQNIGKIEELESIRGVAALLIVFFHMPKWNPLFNIGIINNGYLMVELFFVLSGFVIFNAYSNKINKSNDLFRFQFLRFGRLYPVHLIFLIVYLAIEVAKYLAGLKFGIKSPNSIPFKDNNISAFFENILLIQSILPNRNLTFNYPSWSISVEFYMYLIFGVVILFSKNFKVHVFLLLATVSLIVLISQSTFGFNALFRCVAGFSIGCLTASALNKSQIFVPKYLSTIAFIGIILFLQLKVSQEYDVLIYFLTAALISTLILSPSGFLNNILRFKLFTWLGTISYSVYMSHAAIEWTVGQFYRVILKRPELVGADGKSSIHLSITETLIAYSIVITTVLFVSHFIYILIEKPFRERSRRIAYQEPSLIS